MVFHWGNLTVDLLQVFGTLIAFAVSAVVTMAVRKISPGIDQWMTQNHIDSLMYRALSAAVAKTADAVKGRDVTVPIANTILREAVEYLQNQAPELIEKYGPRIEQMLIARLSEHVALPPEADAKSLGVDK